MGACHQSILFTPKGNVIEEAKGIQEDLCFNYGNGPYQGHLGIKDGIKKQRRVFDSIAEAESWSQDCNNKWGPADLLEIKDGSYILAGWCPE